MGAPGGWAHTAGEGPWAGLEDAATLLPGRLALAAGGLAVGERADASLARRRRRAVVRGTVGLPAKRR